MVEWTDMACWSMLVLMLKSMKMPTRNLEVMYCYTTNTGRRCLPIGGRHEDGGTSEQCVRACVHACLRD